MKKIGLIAAIRQEIQPVLGRFPAAVRTELGDLTAWHFQMHGSAAVDKCLPQCMLVESGIGMTNALRATSALLESFNPEIIVNIGFCGALKAGITTGDLVMAEQLSIYSDFGLQPLTGLQILPANAMQQLPLHRGTFITTETMVSKSTIHPLLGEGMANPVLEMESAAIFRICRQTATRFAAIRAVSDGVDEDPFLLVSDIIGPDLRIDRKKALLALLKKPGHLPQLLRLARNAHLAGESLANSLSCILECLTCD